jgi:DNA-binding transcriptional regulator YbjK
MNTTDILIGLTWFAIAGIVVKYLMDSSKFRRRLSRIRSIQDHVSQIEIDHLAASAEGDKSLKKKIRAIDEAQEAKLKLFEEKQKETLAAFSSGLTEKSTEMNSHLRDKIADYGVQIAELHYKIRELEEKYQLNAVELQEVEYSLEELKDVFGAYYEFLTEFTEEFGLDNSKVYQELMGRTKAIYELVEEVIGRIHGGKNEKDGVRTVATIGKLKAG